MIVELEGEVDESGMVMDYYDLKKIIEPLVEKLDHAFMVYREDKEIITLLEKMNSKMVVVDFQSTVENICTYFLNEIKKITLPGNVKEVSVRIYETADDYAELMIKLSH
jgi:6-pyruvoyltetrahydropterin/6-carboxytetrahydropterin synthase